MKGNAVVFGLLYFDQVYCEVFFEEVFVLRARTISPLKRKANTRRRHSKMRHSSTVRGRHRRDAWTRLSIRGGMVLMRGVKTSSEGQLARCSAKVKQPKDDALVPSLSLGRQGYANAIAIVAQDTVMPVQYSHPHPVVIAQLCPLRGCHELSSGKGCLCFVFPHRRFAQQYDGY